METMTLVEQEQARKERLNEVGTEPHCPFCGQPRVKRSDYIRCNPCGKNWNNGSDITRDPRDSYTSHTKPIEMERSSGAQTVPVSTNERRD